MLGADDGDGVCANVRFPWPATLIDDAIASASTEHATSVDRWDPAHAVWPLLEVLEQNLTQRWCAALARYLADGNAINGRRFAVAARLARSFQAYGHSRPQMLQAGPWAATRPATAPHCPATSPGRLSCGGCCASASARPLPSCWTTLTP